MNTNWETHRKIAGPRESTALEAQLSLAESSYCESAAPGDAHQVRYLRIRCGGGVLTVRPRPASPFNPASCGIHGHCQATAMRSPALNVEVYAVTSLGAS